MDNSIKETLIFLTIVREILIERFSDPKIRFFITNEASDYEIMNLMLHKKFPSEKYNLVKEEKLFKEFKLIVLENFETLSKTTCPKAMNRIIFDIKPVSNYGFSSAKPILEYNIKHKKGVDLLEFEVNFFNRTPAEKLEDALEAGEKQEKKYEKERKTLKKLKEKIRKDDERKRSLLGKEDKEDIEAKSKMGMVKSVAPLAIAAAAGYGAHALYKKYKKHKQDAIMSKINSLRNSMSSCDNSDDPAECKDSLRSQIKSLSNKLT